VKLHSQKPVVLLLAPSQNIHNTSVHTRLKSYSLILIMKNNIAEVTLILDLHVIYRNIPIVVYQQTKHGIDLEVKTRLRVYQITVSDPSLNRIVAFHVSRNSS
jgi:hypothetical protein